MKLVSINVSPWRPPEPKWESIGYAYVNTKKEHGHYVDGGRVNVSIKGETVRATSSNGERVTTHKLEHAHDLHGSDEESIAWAKAIARVMARYRKQLPLGHRHKEIP
jgi:hypothetical protein